MTEFTCFGSTETTCHCGATFGRSSECNFCGCEKFEARCEEKAEFFENN